MAYLPSFEQAAFKIIDCWLDHQIRFSTFPGIQLCIRNKADIVFHKAYGYANRPQRQTLTTDHLFHIASHSKSVTACIVLQLIEQGRLGFDDVVVDYMPEFCNHTDQRFREITIRDLLSHRSGIFRDSYDADFWQFHKPFLNHVELIDAVKDAALIYHPNTKTKYTNIGYGLLGVIIENVTQMSYDQAVDQHVIKKLQLHNTFADYDDAFADRMASGHARPLEDGQTAVFKHQPTLALSSATGFCSNAADISLFMYEMLQGDKLLTPKMRRELISLNWPVPNSHDNEHYGLGIHFETLNNNHFAGHSGGYPGFTTITLHWLDTQYTISVLTNSNDGSRIMGVIQSVAEIMQKLDATFDEKDFKQLTITPSFMSAWESKLMVLTPQKGLVIQLNFQRLCQYILELKAGEYADNYTCPKQNGYEALGEMITLQRNSAGEIRSIKWGGKTILQTDDFLQYVTTSMMPNTAVVTRK